MFAFHLPEILNNKKWKIILINKISLILGKDNRRRRSLRQLYSTHVQRLFYVFQNILDILQAYRNSYKPWCYTGNCLLLVG